MDALVVGVFGLWLGALVVPPRSGAVVAGGGGGDGGHSSGHAVEVTVL